MTNERPNLLFLMADQMQGRVLRPGHPCRTPHLDRLAARGVRFDNAYTPNAICSPARASLMTGLLPHSHGVLTVTHCVDEDQSCLRDAPHWAQRLEAAGYRTGYFGKWHVERSGELDRFGWQTYAEGRGAALYRDYRARMAGADAPPARFSREMDLPLPPGYAGGRFYGVTSEPPERRPLGLTCGVAGEFLDNALAGQEPWCCFVSVTEPHDPFIAGEEAFARYDVDSLPLPPGVDDDLADKPGLYRKVARQVFGQMTDRQKREAAACYYASITEIDAQFGRLIQKLEEAGRGDDTLVVVTSDHGELLGAHGLYCKNVGAFEEVYNIPLLLAGPGVAQGQTSGARVGLHDLCPTLLGLAGLEPIGQPDSRSFAPAARDPEGQSGNFATGYAEYNGTRYLLSQRIAWDGPWKFVHNGFDFDELYNLEDDPYELHNLAALPEHSERVKRMMTLVWQRIRETGDRTLWDTNYPPMRVAPFGPMITETDVDVDER